MITNHDGGIEMSLDERQRTIKQVFSRKQLERMSVEDLVKLVGEAGPGAKLHGTGVVKRADGSIKYAPEAVPGQFHETQEELAAHAARELSPSGENEK